LALAAQLAPALGHGDPSTLAAALAADPGSIAAFLVSAGGAPFLLVIDQLEELYTVCADHAARAAFAATLAAACAAARVAMTPEPERNRGGSIARTLVIEVLGRATDVDRDDISEGVLGGRCQADVETIGLSRERVASRLIDSSGGWAHG
jgi:hypothetical protein